MKQLTIRAMERFTHTRAHVIRTWEQRFKLFTPQRAGNNSRLYSIDDLELLMKISLLIEHGNKISQLANCETGMIDGLVLQLRSQEARQKRHIHQLILSMLKNDTEEFEAALDSALISFGIDQTIETVIMPFLTRVNILSYADTSIEAHFVVTAIRRKLIMGIERINIAGVKNCSVLLYLPQDEHYDLTLLYIHYLLKVQGLRVYYLGTNISLHNLDRAIIEKKPDYLFSYTANFKFPHDAYNHLLIQKYTDLLLYVGHTGDYRPRNKNTRNINYIELSAVPTLG